MKNKVLIINTAPMWLQELTAMKIESDPVFDLIICSKTPDILPESKLTFHQVKYFNDVKLTWTHLLFAIKFFFTQQRYDKVVICFNNELGFGYLIAVLMSFFLGKKVVSNSILLNYKEQLSSLFVLNYIGCFTRFYLHYAKDFVLFHKVKLGL